VKISYPSGNRQFNIISPWRKKNIKRLTRRSYNSFASSVAASSHTSTLILRQVARSIKHEIKAICSVNHSSIIRDAHEGVKFFHWDTVWLELVRNMPTLMKLLHALVHGKKDHSNKILVCLIASMLLKKRVPQMALVQRTISVLLYGNSCSKQVDTFKQ
jgi:hypothetical protein